MYAYDAPIEDVILGWEIMKKNRTKSLSSAQQKRLISVLCCFLAVALVYLALFADQSFLSIMKKKSQFGVLEKEKIELKKNNAELKQEIERAKNDLQYLETVARERNMLKKNEIIIDFSKKKQKEKSDMKK